MAKENKNTQQGENTEPESGKTFTQEEVNANVNIKM